MLLFLIIFIEDRITTTLQHAIKKTTNLIYRQITLSSHEVTQKKKDSIVKNKSLSVATYINFKIVCHNFQCHIKKASIKICLGLGFFVIFLQVCKSFAMIPIDKVFIELNLTFTMKGRLRTCQ